MELSDIEADLTSVLYTEEQIHAKIARSPGRSRPTTSVASRCWWASSRAPSWSWPTSRASSSWPRPWTGWPSRRTARAPSRRVSSASSKTSTATCTGATSSSSRTIIDSGLTLSWLLENLQKRGAASVEIFALFRKPAAAKVAVDVKYVGFEIPNDFVIGYGLDYDEKLPQPARCRGAGPARLQLAVRSRAGPIKPSANNPSRA